MRRHDPPRSSGDPAPQDGRQLTRTERALFVGAATLWCLGSIAFANWVYFEGNNLLDSTDRGDPLRSVCVALSGVGVLALAIGKVKTPPASLRTHWTVLAVTAGLALVAAFGG